MSRGVRTSVVAIFLALSLAGCSTTNQTESQSGSGAAQQTTSTTAGASGAATGPASTTDTPDATPRIPESVAVKDCGDALFFFYGDGDRGPQPDGSGDGWNWRFTGDTREVVQIGAEWRVVFMNTAASNPNIDPESRIIIDGVEQDGHADTWCETQPDGTFSGGVVGGASFEGLSIEELAARQPPPIIP